MDVVSFAVEAVSENVFGSRKNDGVASEQEICPFSLKFWWSHSRNVAIEVFSSTINEENEP
jgi:hypothetical protein